MASISFFMVSALKIPKLPKFNKCEKCNRYELPLFRSRDLFVCRLMTNDEYDGLTGALCRKCFIQELPKRKVSAMGPLKNWKPF